jgi:hypothetical protein
MTKRLLNAAIATAVMLAWTACSESPKPTPAEKTAAEKTAEAPKPPEPVAAQTAFYEMYKPARTWAADLLPLSLSSGEVSSLKNEGGKAATWTAVFVSPGRHEARTFFYSVVSDPERISKGVTAGGSQPWSGPTAKSQPFQITGFVVNSDAAYNAALVKASAWVKHHPDKKVTFILGSTARFPSPAWLVLWGTPKLGYAVYVDATTGKVTAR